MLDPSRHQVLIVEDDAAVRKSLALLLKVSGYEVSTAANGVEALALLKSGLPAVLLSDLYMPEMSGFELLSVVRQQFPKLSLVAMSASYETVDTIPDGVVADAFYPKGNGSPTILLSILSEMTSAPPAHTAEKSGQAKPFIN
ncbi:MAG TPA: response regulator [Candidatus Dormibacteraeota bacterium]|nr:response regulator [Candidatus Dormibacteraeota bacterium]